MPMQPCSSKNSPQDVVVQYLAVDVPPMTHSISTWHLLVLFHTKYVCGRYKQCWKFLIYRLPNIIRKLQRAYPTTSIGRKSLPVISVHAGMKACGYCNMCDFIFWYVAIICVKYDICIWNTGSNSSWPNTILSYRNGSCFSWRIYATLGQGEFNGVIALLLCSKHNDIANVVLCFIYDVFILYNVDSVSVLVIQ